MISVTVLIPAFNEERTVLDALRAVKAQAFDGIVFEIVVVDDGSTDSTAALVEAHPELYTRFIRLPTNRGKGAAVKAGLAAAAGEYVLFQDADLEYDPADYRRLLAPVMRFDADLVMGSRLVAPEYTRVFYFWHKVGNRLLTFLFNVLNNTTFTDIYSCYLLYRRELLDPAKLRNTGWDQHAEILSQLVGPARKMYEVQVSYHGRTYGEGKKIKAWHAVPVIWTIVRERLRRALG